MARKRRKHRRSRKHRRNGSKGMPTWFWPALVVSGLTCVFFYKKANPGVSLNPTT